MSISSDLETEKDNFRSPHPSAKCPSSVALFGSPRAVKMSCTPATRAPHGLNRAAQPRILEGHLYAICWLEDVVLGGSSQES